MKRAAPWLALAAVLAAYLALEIGPFADAFIFHGDHERDLRYATLWVRAGIWPESSPAVAPLPFELGPLLYVLLAPAVAISPEPAFVRIYLLLLAAAAFGLFGRSLTRRVRWEAAVFATWALVASTFTYELSRQLWHSSLLPLPVVGFLWASERLLRPDDPHPHRHAVLAAACAGIAVQLHLTAVTYVGLLAGLLLVRRRTLVPATAALLAALAPMLWTLTQSLGRGALAATHIPGDWSPANPLPFLVDNVHTLWGDNLGPLLTWPLLGLAAAGGLRARGDRFARLLVANVVLGLAVEAALLGNQRAHRYMHANLYAVFGLAAFGLDLVLRHPRLRWTPWAAAAVALAVTVEAAVSPVPHAGGRGWLTAAEQSAVAQVVATRFPLPADAMEARVHGIYFGESMGMGHLHALAEQPALAPFSATAHVLVMPSDLAIEPFGEPVGPRALVHGLGRTIAVGAFRPALDFAHLEAPPELRSRWRRGRSRPDQRGVLAVVRIPALRAGAAHVLVGGARGDRTPCPVQAWLDRQPLQLQPVPMRRYDGVVGWTVPMARAGQLTLRVGPCREVRFFDLF